LFKRWLRGLQQLKDPVLPEGWEKWLLDLVAIATVADMCPLIGGIGLCALGFGSFAQDAP
jgi:hypothetical protein